MTSNFSSFTISGDAGGYLGFSSYMTYFTVLGSVGNNPGFGADHSIFETTNRDTLRSMIEQVEKSKVVYIHPDGRKETVHKNEH